MDRLQVIMHGIPVGVLRVDDAATYHFEYDERWRQDGFAISPHLNFSDDARSATVKKFFENLLPEGKGLDEIIAFAHLARSNVYALLHTIGQETAGALVFGESVAENAPLFREIRPDELRGRIAQIENRSIAIWDKKVRLSLAGVQAKLPVILQEGKMGLGDGTLSSTHIMKFQTHHHLHIVINELFCMQLAQRAGLSVAEVSLKRFGAYPVLLVERFDRIQHVKHVERLHLIDGCQMLDLPPAYKYEQNIGSGRDVAHIREGASFKKLFEMTRVCSVPAKAQLELLNWAMFNLIIGNTDAHGKNISFFVNRHGITPAPLYDTLCVMMYDVDHGMAMAYGDEFDPNDMYAFELRGFAEDAGIHHKLVAKTLLSLCDRILRSLDEGILERDSLHEDEWSFVSRLEELIRQRALHFREVAEQMPLISF